jgi:hypothetical protein
MNRGSRRLAFMATSVLLACGRGDRVSSATCPRLGSDTRKTPEAAALAEACKLGGSSSVHYSAWQVTSRPATAAHVVMMTPSCTASRSCGSNALNLAPFHRSISGHSEWVNQSRRSEQHAQRCGAAVWCSERGGGAWRRCGAWPLHDSPRQRSGVQPRQPKARKCLRTRQGSTGRARATACGWEFWCIGSSPNTSPPFGS